MAELKEKLSVWWVSRSEQEKRTLKIALPIIALMFLYLVLIEPIMGAYFSRKTEYQQAEETLNWLYEQTPLVARMQNNCGNRILYLQNGETPETVAQNIARRSSVNARYQTVGETVSVVVSSAAGNRLLGYVQSLVCNGFAISDLEIRRAESDLTTVSASLTATPIALPSAP